jgi:hypothetical protein
MKNVAGFKIVWTSNLLDHLLVLDADEKVKVHIYHQVKLLQHQQELSRSVISSLKQLHTRISNHFPAL